MSSLANAVMAEVVSTLRGIRREAGFRNTVLDVTEKIVSFARVGRFPSLVVETWRERSTILPARRRRRVLRLRITGFVRPPSGVDKHEAARELMADVEDALMADPTRGQQATLTQVREVRYDFAPHEQGGRAACLVEIVVHEDV